MSDKYKHTYRVLMIDQHFNDAPFIDFGKFSAKKQVEKCLEAKIDSLHLTAKCHAGYSYYRTEVGTKHPALGERDMFGELLEQCRKNDLEAICYYCLIFENLAVKQHPEWSMRTREGEPMNWSRVLGVTEGPQLRRWSMPCISSPYGQYCLDQLGEIARQYDIDGVFLDIFEMAFSSRFLCHCKHCEEYYRKHGLDLWDDNQMFQLLRQKSELWGEFLSRVRRTLNEARPGVSLSLNGGPLIVGHKSLLQVSWPYTEGGEHAYNAVILKNIGVPYPQCGIVGGTFAHDQWKEETVKIQTSTVLAHGSRCFYFFTMGRNPDFIFDRYKYDLMEKVNSETEKKQPYIEEAEHEKCVAIYYNESSKILSEIVPPDKKYDFANDGEMAFERGFGKTIDAVRSTNLPCEVLPNWRCSPKELSQYRMIIVPEMECLSDEEIENLTRYVKGGGYLLVTGTTGMKDENASERSSYPLHDLLGVKFEGWRKEFTAQGISGYVEYSDHDYFQHLRDLRYLVRGDWPMFTSKTAKVVSRMVPPIAVESEDNFIGWNPLPPAPKAGKYVAVTTRKVGRGRAVFCSVALRKLLELGVVWPGELIRGIIGAGQLPATVSVDGPPGLEVTWYWQKDRLVIHLLNQTIRALKGDVIPLRDIRLTLNDSSLKNAKLRMVWPKKKPLEIKQRKGKTTIDISSVEIHTILIVKSKK